MVNIVNTNLGDLFNALSDSGHVQDQSVMVLHDGNL